MSDHEGYTVSDFWPEPTGFWREPDGATVTLTGDLPHWARHTSGQGRTYATGVLRLLDGDVPILVPPAVYQRVGGLLGEDARLTITGRVDRRSPIHMITVQEVDEPDLPADPPPAGKPPLIPWEDLTPGRIIRYRHISRTRRLAGRELLVRRARIEAVYPQTKNGSMTITPLNKNGTPNRALGRVTIWRDLGGVLSVEPVEEVDDAAAR